MILKDKINNSLNIIHKGLSYGNGVVAYSGGKDGFVMAHLVNKVQPSIPMVCELSFYFPEVIEFCKESMSKHNFNVLFKESLSDSWLHKHPEYIFASSSKIRAITFFQRQQKTIKKFAKEKNASITFTGRRTQENSVKAEIYNTKNNGLQCHPLRDWTTKDIWKYFEENNISKPPIYKTEFGRTAHNAPFYSLNMSHYNNDLDRCWEVIRESSPKQTFEQRFRQ